AVPKGIISHIEETKVQFYTQDQRVFYATRDRCFLYNVSLQAVNIMHVLVKGLVIEYEICKGAEVKGVWLPSSNTSLSSEDLYFAMCRWCDNYDVPYSTRNCL
ncbi:unnamed protein product, partial [Meganyctiphanes norvegica]